MTRTRNQDFIRGTDERQARLLYVSAVGAIAVIVMVVVGYTWISPRFQKSEAVDLTIDLSYVGPGVGAGTKVILRGAQVGEVLAVDRFDSDQVRLTVALDPADIDGLSDTFDIDFRPKDYFGVTAVNLIGRAGGNPLVSGQTITRAPLGDFTMSTMIQKSSVAVDGTLTHSMIDALDKVVRYTDGLTPMIETGILVADQVARTQQAMPSTLLDDLNGTLDVLPGFSAQAVDALDSMFDHKMNRLPDGSYGVREQWWAEGNEGLSLAAFDLFGSVGALLGSHGTEVSPVTLIVAELTNALPALLDNGDVFVRLSELADRYGAAFSGPPEARTLNLRVVLDDLPAPALPAPLPGGVPPADQEVPR